MSDIVRADRERGMDRRRTDMADRWFSDFFPMFRDWSGGRREASFPALDVYSCGDDLVVLMDLPGVEKEDVDITVTNETLTISGRTDGAQGIEGDLIWDERFKGSFSRSIKLFVPVKADDVRASFCNGALKIELPKAEDARPRSIQITD